MLVDRGHLYQKYIDEMISHIIEKLMPSPFENAKTVFYTWKL